MTSEDILEEFRAVDALMNGHFILSSGLHSDTYLQCARVMMDARRGARLCKKLADKVRARVSDNIDLIVSPAIGGILVGYEMGRQLNILSIFLERVAGIFVMRRGFDIFEGSRCLMVEDVVTTGLSSRECISSVVAAGGKVVAGAALIDRSGGKADIGVPLIALSTLCVKAYPADALPSFLENLPAVRLGSRVLSDT